MSFEIADQIEYGGHSYKIDTYPLEPYFALNGYARLESISPFCSRGYVADWTVEQDRLLLAKLWPSPRIALSTLFPSATGPVLASWYTGWIHAWRGERRRTGYPSRTFYNHEVIFGIRNGVIIRIWELDLRDVPDQTDDELRQELPAFLRAPKSRGEAT
jgi:hypothetical protein